MSLIQVSNLTFAYEGSYETIFENVSFQIDTNWRLGFIGRNGRGKTTFLNLLMGKYPYRGSISASVRFSYFPYTVADPTVTAMEVVSQIHPDCEYWQLAREMSRLKLEEEILYQPYCTLSGGEQTKLQLAVLFLRENNFLLIDEPTNHLDIRGRELVSRYLAGKSGFILVSHDRAFLDGCVDHILSINKADIEVQRGNFSSWQENRQRRDDFERAENRKLTRQIHRLEETAREKAQWAATAESRKFGADPLKVDKPKNYRSYQGAKSAKTMSRAKAIEKRQQAAIEEKSALLKNIERSDSLKLFQTPFHQKRLALLQEVSIAYGEKTVCENISFTVEQGDRIALMGTNGSGKSSILKLLLGQITPRAGTVRIGTGLTVSWVPQDSAGLRGNLRELAMRRGIDESLLLAMLAKLDVAKVQTEKDLGNLSAGQKKKVLLAASICENTHLHIWDEPMNYIEVISRMQIEQLLLQYTPTIVFVDHDRVFCENIATKTIEL